MLELLAIRMIKTYIIFLFVLVTCSNKIIAQSQEVKFCKTTLLEQDNEGIKEIRSYNVKKRDTSLSYIKLYDESGRLISHIFFEENDTVRTIEYVYDQKGQMQLMNIIWNGDNSIYDRREEYFYEQSCIVKKYNIKVGNDTVFSYYERDITNNILTETIKQNEKIIENKYIFNEDGTLYSQRSDDKFELRYKYDMFGNMIAVFKKSDVRFSLVYDLNNNLIEYREIDEEEEFSRTIYRYDSLNRMTYLKETDWKQRVFKIVEYDYNSLGERTSSFYYKRHKKKPDEVFFEKKTIR